MKVARRPQPAHSRPENNPAVAGPASLPALAAALRRSDRREHLPAPWHSLMRYDPLAPMYRIPAGAVEAEAGAAVHVLLAVADRLRRLTTAYGEWEQFDASAFFDLSHARTERLVHIAERVTTVHVTVYTDQLLPAFAKAAAYWQQEFRPTYWELRGQLANGHHIEPVSEPFTLEVAPTMAALWQEALLTLRHTRRLLGDEIGFWAANGAGEERGRHRAAWQHEPAPGLDAALLPSLEELPTLTLAIDFPLPAARQPGRLRRLQRLQLRRRAGRLRARSA